MKVCDKYCMFFPRNHDTTIAIPRKEWSQNQNTTYLYLETKINPVVHVFSQLWWLGWHRWAKPMY